MISIIIPAYNAQKHIERCIKSCIGQTYGDLEVIIIDDGSTDATYEICRSFLMEDNRIRLYKNDKNRGVSYTRNRGKALANGEWVTFVDSDDIMDEKCLENALEGVKKADCDMLIWNLLNTDEYNSGGVSSIRR